MDTQILLEEKRALLIETKELIVDESKIFGGHDITWEITDGLSIEYKRRSTLLG